MTKQYIDQKQAVTIFLLKRLVNADEQLFQKLFRKITVEFNIWQRRGKSFQGGRSFGTFFSARTADQTTKRTKAAQKPVDFLGTPQDLRACGI